MFCPSHAAPAGVVRSASNFPCTASVLAVGRAFHRRFVASEEELNRVAAAGAGAADDCADLNLVIPDLENLDLDEATHYDLLGIPHLGLDATLDQITRAHRRLLLHYHPDKTGRGEDDDAYLAFQTAYTTLSIIERRRAYDSQCQFDEGYPSANATKKGDFFALWRPVFERNARFAERQPVPELGDENTGYDEVTAFYEYWRTFDSWRDFTYDAEHDLDAADCREERRQWQKENETAAKKKKKKEYTRLATMCDVAYACDPRVKAMKQAAKDAKAKAKADKENAVREAKEAKQRAAAEAEAQAKAAADAAREEAKAAKAVRDEQKRLMRMKRSALRRKCFAVCNEQVSEDDVHMCCEVFDVPRVEALLQRFEEDEAAAIPEMVAAVQEAIETKAANEAAEVQAKLDAAAAAEAARAAEQERLANRVHEWTTPQQGLLAKGANKFPAGAQQRWEKVAEFLNQQLPDLPDPITKAQCIAEYQRVNNGGAVVAGPGAGAKMAAGATAEAKAGPKVSPQVKQQAVRDVDASLPASKRWTPEQQQALEAGLKANPPSMEVDARWTAISSSVPGKNKKECAKRFKAVRERVQAIQAGR